MSLVLLTDFAWPDVSIERKIIEQAGHVLVRGHSTPAPAEAIEALVAEHDPQAIMTCWAEVTGRAIEIPTDLRIVQRIGVGLDNIDVAAASSRGAWVANVPDYCVGEVADHAIALLLGWARGLVALDRDVKEGSWNPAGVRLRRLADLSVGIIGYGRIGQNCAAKLRAFGCEVIVHRRRGTGGRGVEPVPLDDLLARSDAVIIHAPLTDETHHLINASRIAQMKPGAFLINVSRGPIVDSAALVTALEQGRLSGAGLDVIEGEPDPPRALVDRRDVIVSPHVAFSSDSSLEELRQRAAEEVVRVLAGAEPLYPCNRPEQRS